MNLFWFEKQWKNLLVLANIAVALIVAVLSTVDIYGPRVGFPLTLLRMIDFFMIPGSILAVVFAQKIEQAISDQIQNHPLFNAVLKSNAPLVAQYVSSSPALANYKFPEGITFLAAAARKGSKATVDVLLKAGAQPTSPDNANALIEAICSGQKDVYDLLRSKITDAQLAQICVQTGLSELGFAAYEGRAARVRELATRGNVNLSTYGDVTPLHMAALGSRDREIVGILMDLGANPNALAKFQLFKDSQPVVAPQGFSPMFLAIVAKDLDLALFLYSRNNDVRLPSDGKDHVMLACEFGLLKFVEACFGSYNFTRKDSNGKTASDYAKASGHQNIVDKIAAHSSATSGSASKSSASQATQQAAQSFNSKKKRQPLTSENVLDKLMVPLDGLVGLEEFSENFSYELSTFLNSEPGMSRGLVVWGEASVGKTSFGKRIAGLEKMGDITPKLEIDDVEIKYIACCDTDIDIAKEANEASSKSIIILDEIDKYFNPKAGIVDEAQAKRLRTSIVTNFQNKPIFWVFLGTFKDLRGDGNLTERDLVQLLGPELTSRLDFADWQLPRWNADSMLKAALHTLSKDAEKVDYEDSAMNALVLQALESQGGVRQLLQYHGSFKREAERKQAKLVVDLDQVQTYLKRLNAA